MLNTTFIDIGTVPSAVTPLLGGVKEEGQNKDEKIGMFPNVYAYAIMLLATEKRDVSCKISTGEGIAMFLHIFCSILS